MKSINKTILKFTIAAMVLAVIGSCTLTDLNINKDPNNPTTAPLDLLLTSVELNGVAALEGPNYDAHGFMGLMSSGDGFDLSNSSYNGSWNYFYSGPMKDLDEIIKSTSKAGNNPFYLGIGQAMKAYFFGMWVDLFGDIPYSQAFQGNASPSNKYPSFDKDKDIYDDLLKLCDSAVINLSKTSAVSVKGDLMYGGNVKLWTKFANSVKLKLLINSRRVRPNAAAEIQAVLAAGNLISNFKEDFTFKYNKSASPEGRHPWFQNAYLGDNGFPHISHQFMLELLDNEDPRLPFYLRRQADRILNPADPTDKGTIPAFRYLVLTPAVWQKLYYDKGKTPTKADSIYIAGFFGRDRGDLTGVPADGALRTAPGCYPAGGLYDVKQARTLTGNTGSGNGIFPLLTSNMIKWWIIEYKLAYNVGSARADFESAIRESIANVVRLGLSVDPSNAVVPADSSINKYVNLWLSRYDNAMGNEAKLNVVLKQAWFSNWGNGYEIYNAFRRTGYPTTIDPPHNRRRQFALRLPYPAAELSINSNAPKNPPVFDGNQGIFWDVIKFKF